MEDGKRAVLSGQHGHERLPSEGGRWGAAVILRPEGSLAAALDALVTQAAGLVGPGHWLSGSDGLSHVTVRALERRPAARDPLRDAALAKAMVKGAAGTDPALLVFDGLCLAPASVMATAHSPDGSGERLRDAMARHFTNDLEATEFARDPVWYATLVHFAGPIRNPAGLVSWVEERAGLALGVQRFNDVELCRYDFEGRGMRPVTLAKGRLAGLNETTSGSEPRLIDLIFEANARLRAVGREHGVRSEEYAALLDELRLLRQQREEERVIRGR